MTITVKNTYNRVPFSDITLGECFTDEGNYLIRMENSFTEVNVRVNAVNLNTGETYFYNENDMVIPVNAELIVK